MATFVALLFADDAAHYSVPDFRFVPELGSRFPPGLEGAYGRLKNHPSLQKPKESFGSSVHIHFGSSR